MPTPIEQTYRKLHCNTCGCTTPHRDNSTTMQCEVCLYSNYSFHASVDYYTGWELAMFWQQKYRSVVGYGRSFPVTAVAGPANQIAVTVGDKTWWTDPPAKKVQCPMPDANYNIMLVEGIQGGVLASPVTAPLPHSVGMIPSIDPNSIGTL